MLCQPFKDSIRDAGENALSTDDDMLWESVDGKIAQLILCDQISRNCYRGIQTKHLHMMIQPCYIGERVDIQNDYRDDSTGETDLSYVTVLVTALMHSEDLADHENNLKLVELGAKNAPQTPQLWNGYVSLNLSTKW